MLAKTLTYILSFHQVLSTTVMSTDVSQLDVALFPIFKHFLAFHLSRFSFYINTLLSSLADGRTLQVHYYFDVCETG